MIISNQTIVSFEVDKPNEFTKCAEFEKENPDWIKSCTTHIISFSHKSVQSIEIKEKSSHDGCREDS